MHTFRWVAVGLSLGTYLTSQTPSVAQDAALVPDTGQTLMPVTVRAFAPERFMAGLHVQRTDSALLAAYSYQTVAELLALQAPIQFKSYGPGQLTTVGFRGTSASHTAVLWNGVNINPPSLGQTDFSTLPVAGFDRMSVQYGSAASVVGSDAVGGSILLSSSPGWERRGLSATVGQRVGAWGTAQTQAGVRFGTYLRGGGQLTGKTVLYGGQTRFVPTDRERNGYLYETSETPQRGFIQDLFYRDKRQRQLALNIWLTDNTLTISPADTAGRETTRTAAYRFLTSYEFGDARPGQWLSGRTTLRVGFLRDLTDYGKGRTYATNPSRAETDRLLLRAEHELDQRLGTTPRPLTVRVGAEWSHYAARVDGYGAGPLTEQRADIYALSRYQATNRLLVSLNLRQAFVTGYNPPFTPSLGVDYQVLVKENWQLSARANLARSYRVPTLNERYWKTLGNPDIRPERGFSQEIGLALTRNIPSHSASLNVSAFRNHVDDWTYWNPARGYRVENLQEVLARGLEVQGRFSQTLGTWRLGTFGQYAYTRSSQLRVYDPSAVDVVGKQLVYLPLHTASATAFVQHGPHRLTLTWQGVDRRPNTFDNSQFLPPYTLLGLIAETGMRVGGWQGRAVVQVDNLLNEFYLNVKRNAMPGRLVALTFILTAHTKPD